MTEQSFASVWDAIEETPAQAENMRLRAKLMMAISEHIRAAGLNQTQAAKVFAVTQPRISDLMRGKINLFSIDMLVAMLSSAGVGVEMRILPAGPARAKRTGKGRRGVGRVAARATRQRAAA